LDTIRDTITNLFFSSGVSYNNQVYITNVRHKEKLMEARESLGRVVEALQSGVEEDLVTIDMMAAYASLGEIIGEEVGDDLADKIFSDFCMGK